MVLPSSSNSAPLITSYTATAYLGNWHDSPLYGFLTSSIACFDAGSVIIILNGKCLAGSIISCIFIFPFCCFFNPILSQVPCQACQLAALRLDPTRAGPPFFLRQKIYNLWFFSRQVPCVNSHITCLYKSELQQGFKGSAKLWGLFRLLGQLA